MLNERLTRIRPALWLYAFIFIHVLAWTLTPWLTRSVLPLDSLEGTIWGHQLEWGYDKNPFLNAWLTNLAVHLSGTSAWAIYLFSQLSVGICFFAVWRLGCKILPPLYALFAVLILEGVQYFNFHAIDFDDNTIELSLWALTTLFFYKALREQTWRTWLCTGLFAGLSMMTKYYSIILLLNMLLLLIANQNARQNFKSLKLYAAIGLCTLICLPHIVWLFSHDFITFTYALNRVGSAPTLFNHLHHPFKFFYEQLEVFAPAIALALILLIGKQPWMSEPRIKTTLFDKEFLFFMGLGPFLLTVFLAFFTGIYLRAAWGQPLLSFWGIILMALLSPNITPERFYRTIAIYAVIFSAMVLGYAESMLNAKNTSSANFPGREMAAVLTHEWHDRFHTPLHYVAGNRWIAGNAAFYSADKPAVYIDSDVRFSPWINEKELRQQGAIFVWDKEERAQIPYAEIKKRFPHLEHMQVRSFKWVRDNASKPVEIDTAILPPQH